MTSFEAPVQVVPYDAAWPARFDEEAAILRRMLAPWLVGPIEHIGSAILLTLWATATVLWVLSATAWKAATLKKLPPGAPAWFWLRTFGLPESDQNRGRLLDVAAIVGITLLTAVVGAMLLFGD